MPYQLELYLRPEAMKATWTNPVSVVSETEPAISWPLGATGPLVRVEALIAGAPTQFYIPVDAVTLASVVALP
jgi:hypothetical protein